MDLASGALALMFSAALAGLPMQPQTQTATTVAIHSPITLSKAVTVRDQVEAYFADIPIMADIAGCESQFRQFNTNGDVFRGEKNHFDVGVMQINETYQLNAAQALGYDIYTLKGNMAYARYLYEHEGTAPWSSSEYCWSKSEHAPASDGGSLATRAQ